MANAANGLMLHHAKLYTSPDSVYHTLLDILK